MNTYLTGPVFKGLRVHQSGPVLSVELHAPETGNALTAAMLDELLAVLSGLPDRPDIRILVLSGAGDDFCVGADREEYGAALRTDPGGGLLRRIGDKAQRVCEVLESAGVVTVARLHGKVIGAGLALAAFCDLRVGADTCRFRMPEVGLGVPPAWGGALGRLVSEAGASRIRRYMLTCEGFGAAQALDMAILHKVAAPHELDAAIESWVRPLTRRSPEALTLTKRMLTVQSRANRPADSGLLDAHLLVSQLAPLPSDPFTA
ncbi:enoyl-CoA hydratase/isomerase family protein [Streptomyces sp.]|uniref:enoyl-CoA hydratase/isomerase family protein n=1 Tax=Streptomyces sp. TaxID=1931 RepID=UPI002F3E7367